MSNQHLEQNSFLFGPNGPFIADLYGRFLADPGSVDPSWQGFFRELNEDARAVIAATVSEHLAEDHVVHSRGNQAMPAGKRVMPTGGREPVPHGFAAHPVQCRAGGRWASGLYR